MIFHSPFAADHGNVAIKETLGGYRMFNKIAVSAGVFAVAALWFAPSVVGSANGQTAEEPTLAEVSRDASPMFSGFSLNLVSAPKVLPGGISEDEAAKIALARGAAIRAAREDGRTLNDLAAEIDEARGTEAGLATALRVYVLARVRCSAPGAKRAPRRRRATSSCRRSSFVRRSGVRSLGRKAASSSRLKSSTPGGRLASAAGICCVKFHAGTAMRTLA